MAYLEDAKKLNHATRLLIEADQVVWSQPAYPQEHRPDIAYMAKHLMFGRGVRTKLQPHPNLKPENFAASKEALKASGLEHAARTAEYDPFRREMVIDPVLFDHDDSWIRRVLVHESAHDISERMQIIPGASLSPKQQEGLTQAFNKLFKKNTTPKMRQITVKKSGFRSFYFANDKVIGEQPRPIPTVVEVYPTMVELITDQIIKLNGNIEKFDQLASQDHLPYEEEQNDRHFFNNLAQAMTYIDWRILLDAFKTGDLDQTFNKLEAGHKEAAAGIFLNLTDAIKEDQDRHIQSQISSRLARFTGTN